jgi:hypothetical protein
MKSRTSRFGTEIGQTRVSIATRKWSSCWSVTLVGGLSEPKLAPSLAHDVNTAEPTAAVLLFLPCRPIRKSTPCRMGAPAPSDLSPRRTPVSGVRPVANGLHDICSVGQRRYLERLGPRLVGLEHVAVRIFNAQDPGQLALSRRVATTAFIRPLWKGRSKTDRPLDRAALCRTASACCLATRWHGASSDARRLPSSGDSSRSSSILVRAPRSGHHPSIRACRGHRIGWYSEGA